MNDGVLTVASDGTISNFASDDGGVYWASWDEGLSGNTAVTATGALVLNSTDGANYGPVSYTHLDVYKRQVLW